MSMTLENIFSQLEGISRKLNNKEGSIENIKVQFDKELGIDKKEHDKVVSLIEQFEDSEESMRQYKEQIYETEKSLIDLNKVIQNLKDELSNGTLSPSGQTKKQGELDNKLTERNRLTNKKDRLQTNYNKEEDRNYNIKGRLSARGVTDTAKAVAANKEMNTEIVSASKGSGMTKALGGVKGNAYVVVAQMLIGAIEFGIGKATEYAKVAGENLMRTINATTVVALNQMKAGFDAWQDAVNGAYSAQMLAAESQLELVKAQNANTLASYKLENTWTNWIPIWGEINKYNETALEIEQQMAETRMQNANKVIAQVNEFTKKTDDYIKKQDKAVHQYQALNGLSVAQIDAFEKRLFAQGVTFSQFNKTIEDALRLQNTYTEQSGRAINFSDNDFKQTLAVGRFVGEDNLTAFQAQMQIFNHSVAESADIMLQMYKDANKMGLSQQKLVKNVLANLKLANKYDFKNGTKGFIEFAKWAENTRFNIGSLGGAVEKVQSGGLEGVMTQAARLQVLGGRFAMNADPIAMMFEAHADPDAYARRIAGSLEGMGSTDNATGETTFYGTDNMMLRSAAEAYNMDVEDLKNIVREERKKQTVKRQMGSSSLTGKQKDLVANKAQRDETTGEWYVETLQGQRLSVNDVKESDLNNLKAEDTAKTAVEYAKGTYSFAERITANTNKIDAFLGDLTFDNFAETVKTNIEETWNAYERNASSIKEAIVNNRFQGMKELQEMLSHLGNIDGQYKNALDIIANKGMLTEEQKGQELRAHFLSGSASPEEIDLLKENPQYRKGLTIEQMKRLRKTDTRGISSLWDWHRDSNWKAGDEGDDATNYRNVARAQALDNSAQKNWRRGNVQQALFDEAEAMRTRGNNGIAAQGLERAARGGLSFDGVFNSNGSSMAVAAKNVTPIHDGAVQITRTDPKDVGLFAKTGGPFDTLFNGIFKRINELHEAWGSPSATIRQQWNEALGPQNQVIPIASESSYIREKEVTNYQQNADSTTPTSPQQHQPIDINLHGIITLKSENGQSFDISRQLETDPLLIRSISRIIAKQISVGANGGRGLANLAIGSI